MSKVIIFRYEQTGGPGYFGEFLDKNDIEYQIVKVDQNEPVPTSIDDAAALVFLGGVMSANDELEWIPPTLDLIRAAQHSDIPMLGHCLGGQLIARALGGTVSKNAVPEIGWLPVGVVRNEHTPKWCQSLPSELDVFHWHHETFSIPHNAQHLFKGATCFNQGFQMGKTLALQFHLEILPQMVTDWATLFLDESHKPSASVQSRQDMLDGLAEKSESSIKAAEQVYSFWCSNLP